MKRLSPAFLTMLMLGVVGVLVTMYVAKTVLGRSTPEPQEEILTIPMALTDLEPGTKIEEGHIGTGRARRSRITADTIQANRVAIGRVVKNAIKAAEPISTFDLYPLGKGPGLQVTAGMRAVTIDLGSATSLADGQIQPDQYVDVHFTPSSTPNENVTGGMTMTLFKGVKVLAINGNSRGATATRGANTVTLELTEGQANIMLLARDKGALDLVYTPDGKGDGVVAVDDATRATLDQILGLKPPEEEKIDPPFVTEVYTGSGRRMQEFKDGLRSDRYAIEKFDYNSRYNNDRGPWGGFIGQPSMPDWENRAGGYFSVPSTGGAAAPSGQNTGGQNDSSGNGNGNGFNQPQGFNGNSSSGG